MLGYVIDYMYNKCTNAGESFFSRIVLISWNFQHYSIIEYIHVHLLQTVTISEVNFIKKSLIPLKFFISEGVEEQSEIE